MIKIDESIIRKHLRLIQCSITDVISYGKASIKRNDLLEKNKYSIVFVLYLNEKITDERWGYVNKCLTKTGFIIDGSIFSYKFTTFLDVSYDLTINYNGDYFESKMFLEDRNVFIYHSNLTNKTLDCIISKKLYDELIDKELKISFGKWFLEV